MGVEIAGSIEDLVNMADVILLETNDGNLHLEQALRVFRTGKRVFIDKPVAGSLRDASAITSIVAGFLTFVITKIFAFESLALTIAAPVMVSGMIYVGIGFLNRRKPVPERATMLLNAIHDS